MGKILKIYFSMIVFENLLMTSNEKGDAKSCG